MFKLFLKRKKARGEAAFFEAGQAFFLPQHMIYFFIFPFGGYPRIIRTTRKKVFRPLWDFETWAVPPKAQGAGKRQKRLVTKKLANPSRTPSSYQGSLDLLADVPPTGLLAASPPTRGLIHLL